jgi:hypothetical protein
VQRIGVLPRYVVGEKALFKLGLATEFRSEKIPRNRLGMASVILWKKVLIPKHSESRQHVFVRDMLRNGIPRVCLYFFPRIGIPCIFLLIPRVCFYFCSMVQNSEQGSPLWNGSERNSESFPFRGTARIPPERTNYFVYSVFRGITFFVGNCQP